MLGNEGAGVIEDAGDSGLPVGSRVMFTGPYGLSEAGTWQEWLLVRAEHLTPVPDAIDDVVAAGLPVAYLTAQVTLTLAGFKQGMTVLAPGIGGSVGKRDLSARQSPRCRHRRKVLLNWFGHDNQQVMSEPARSTFLVGRHLLNSKAIKRRVSRRWSFVTVVSR